MKLEIKIDFFFFFALFWFQRKNLQRRRRERTRRQKQKQKKRRRQRRMRRSCQRRKTQLLLRFLVSISFVTSCLVQFVLRFALNQVLQLVDTAFARSVYGQQQISVEGNALNAGN
uniref:Uncharacterized protein n=1 Tax=Brassica campestris TaxID=3711 RepID=A0A3P6B6N8_BRACM|nr:unnamed protein product [Brassica rapa]